MPFLTGTMYMIALAGPFYIMYIGYQLPSRSISTLSLDQGKGVFATSRAPGNIVTHLYLTYDTPCDPNVDLEAGITDHRQPPSHHWDQGVS